LIKSIHVLKDDLIVWIRESIAKAAFSPSFTGSTAPGSPASKRKANAFPGQFHFATFTLL